AALPDSDRARIPALAGGLRREDRAILAGAAPELEVRFHRRHCDDLDGRLVLRKSTPAVFRRRIYFRSAGDIPADLRLRDLLERLGGGTELLFGHRSLSG